MKKLLCLFLTFGILLCIGCTNPQESFETTDATSESHEAYIPQWHLSETLEYDLLLPDSPTDVGVKVPLVYEATENGFFFRFEFFEEFYPIGSMMQVRISVTNNTGKDVVYHANIMLGDIRNDDDTITQATVFHPVLDPNNGEPLDDGDYAADYIARRDFKAGETLVFERAIRISPNYFFVDKTYTFRFYLNTLSPNSHFITVKIPLSVVNRYE